jgi:hypothetical protein
MSVDARGRLWACNNSPEHDTTNRTANIHVYDLKTRRLLKKYSLHDGKKHLFNDVYFTANGDAYATDSEAGAIYRIQGNNAPEEFVKAGSLRYPNGITATSDEKKLLVSSGGLGIVAVDLESRQVTPLRHDKFYVIGTDGLYRYKSFLIGVQNIVFPEAILKFTLDANATKIDDIDFLISDHPSFDIPTTGVVVEDYFYFIANSQLRQLIGNKGSIKDPDKLVDTTILKIKLN